MKKTNRRTSWKKLTVRTKRKIVNDFNAGEVRNQILRQYQIVEGQFYNIIRNAFSENNETFTPVTS
ncbi:MAG: hypothetical protein HY841_14215 [Bacteroidetes bacterium]|nr:hypothetical protein [Bacteroidota bacterium]